MPLVSVLITAYNREKYIAEAIESVLNSTFTDYEIIVVDDGSSDNTVQIANKYLKQDTRVKVYVNGKNIGQFANRNKAASLAVGKYLKYLDSDDKMQPMALSVMVNGMENADRAGMGIEYYAHSPFIKDDKLPVTLSSAEAYQSNFEGGGLLAPGPSSCIYAKEKFNAVGGFDESFGINTDVHLNLKIAAISDVVVLPIDLIFWRRHTEQVHEGQTDQFNMIKEKFDIYKDILLSNNNPVGESDKKFYYKIQQVLYARNLFKLFLFKGKITMFFKLVSPERVSFFQLVYAIIPIRLLKKVYNHV
jgi:glycosyltransferase involved in cell wall biosynthesis